MGQMDGKVAVITGGARGQGRSHAIRLAEESADVVICDIIEQVGSVPFPTRAAKDLDETVAAVEKTGRCCVAIKTDVRNTADIMRLADTAMNEFGRSAIHLAKRRDPEPVEEHLGAHRRGLGRHDRYQPDGRVQVLPGGRPAHPRGRRRRHDPHHLVDRRLRAVAGFMLK